MNILPIKIQITNIFNTKFEEIDETQKLARVPKINNTTETDNLFESIASCFNFKYKDSDYVVTLHHGQLIDSVIIEDNKYSITNENIINTIWNEILVIKNTQISNYKIFKNYRLYAPHKDDLLFIKTNGPNIQIKMKNYKFINLNNMNFNPYNLYLECEINETYDLRSLSGSPIITKDNTLIGIMAKYDIINNLVYVIPIYYLIKTLTKVNNNEIYGVNFEGICDVPKTLYHKFLKTELPIETYIMLEGDQEKDFKLNKLLLRYENINNIFPLSNSRYLEKKVDYIIVTNCFLITIKNIVKEQMRDIIKYVELFKNRTILCIISKTNEITERFKFKRIFKIDEIEYEIMLN